MDRGGAGHLPLGPPRRRALRHRARAGRVGREPRRDRLPPLAVAARRHRASRRAADRHRPAAGHRLRRREGAWPRSCARRWRRSATRAGRRPPATAASTSPAGSSREWEFPVVRRSALAFAREIERRAPELVTTAWWKEERGEKVFIDYNQNARDRTIASAYSVRARPDAAVSAPVTWDELPDVETEDFTLVSMPPRFAELGDVQAAIDDTVCDLRVLLEWVERDEAAGRRRGAVPAELPEDAGRAAARAAVARADARTRELDPSAGFSRTAVVTRRRAVPSTVSPPGSRGGRSSAQVHDAGSLSGRKRSSFVPWRKRCPAPCRSAPRPRARDAAGCSSRPLPPQRFGSEKRRSGASSSSGSTCSAIAACRPAATAAEPT